MAPKPFTYRNTVAEKIEGFLHGDGCAHCGEHETTVFFKESAWYNPFPKVEFMCESCAKDRMSPFIYELSKRLNNRLEDDVDISLE